MKHKGITSRIIDGMILFVLILFISSAGFQDKNTSGWYQQWLPDLNGSSIKSITFLDSLIGYAVTTTNSLVQAYILKTTNGGDNWSIIHTYIPPSQTSGFTRIQFANSNTGYASINYFDFLKTTNAGINWIQLLTPWGGDDMAVINTDTILLVDYDPIYGGVYRSINGGLNWTRIWTGGTSALPYNIYMFNKDMGFFSDDANHYLMKTTNGGFNWFYVNDTSFVDMEFADTLIGYKIQNEHIYKSTDGGLIWNYQSRPSFIFNATFDLSLINRDTVWYVGPEHYNNSIFYGVIMKTTNGGLNWGYQIPYSNFNIYSFINFTDKNNGWAYEDVNIGIHTTTGGSDTTIFVGLTNENEIIPEDYVLEQNYPNPFNSMTNVKWQMLNSGTVEISVFDISGKEISVLVNEYKPAGSYSVNFHGNELPSGIYLYRLSVDGKTVSAKKMILAK